MRSSLAFLLIQSDQPCLGNGIVLLTLREQRLDAFKSVFVGEILASFLVAKVAVMLDFFTNALHFDDTEGSR